MNQDNIPFGTGAHPSIPDERDELYKDKELSYGFPFPTQYQTNLSIFVPNNLKNQLSLGVCTASLSYYIEYLYWKKTGIYVKLSMAFLYLVTKRFVDGNTTEGSSARSALKAAQNLGICTEATFPSNFALSYEDFMAQIIPQAAMDEALNYKIGQYSSIPLEPSLIAGAIYKYGLLYGRVEIDSHWWTPSWLPKDIDPLQPPTAAFTGHMINLFGYDDSQAKTKDFLLNSWGQKWDNNGTGSLIHEDYMPHMTELWAVTLDPIQPAKVDASPQISIGVIAQFMAILRKIGLIS